MLHISSLYSKSVTQLLWNLLEKSLRYSFGCLFREIFHFASRFSLFSILIRFCWCTINLHRVFNWIFRRHFRFHSSSATWIFLGMRSLFSYTLNLRNFNLFNCYLLSFAREVNVHVLFSTAYVILALSNVNWSNRWQLRSWLIDSDICYRVRNFL